MFLTSVWILSKSGLVEGILDGSKLVGGKAVPVSVNRGDQPEKSGLSRDRNCIIRR